MTDHAQFVRAARDFYDAGPEKFTPGYEQYGDLLQAAEALAAPASSCAPGEVERLAVLCRTVADRATANLDKEERRWRPTRAHYEGMRNDVRAVERALAALSPQGLDAKEGYSVEVVRDMDVPRGAFAFIDAIAAKAEGPHRRIETPQDAEVIVFWHNERPAAVVVNLRDQFNHSIQFRAALSQRPEAKGGFKAGWDACEAWWQEGHTGDPLERYHEALSATPSQRLDAATVERVRIIAEARRNLRLTQGCLECNADDERRWIDTITWLESLA